MIQDFEIFFQILLAAIFGGLLGIEREFGKKEAGLRTYMLVCIGSCLFTISALYGMELFAGDSQVKFDPIRIIQAVAIGVGFIGSGLIIFRRDHLEGLTTAAGLWVVSAIGVAVGLKLYLVALFVTGISLIILTGLLLFEKKFIGKK